AQRWIVERQGVADDSQLAFLRALRQGRGNEIGRGHQAISILMMFIDADAVEAELVGIGESVDVFAVEIMALDGVVKAIGQPDPGGIVFGVKIGREEGPGHEVEEVVLHCSLQCLRLSVWTTAKAQAAKRIAARLRRPFGLNACAWS